MRVAIDLDGVILRTVQAVLTQNTLAPFREEYINQYDTYKVVGITKEALITMFNTLDGSKVELYPLVWKGLAKLLNHGHYVFFLTHKTPEMVKWTEVALKRHHLSGFKMVVSHRKQDENSYDILVEDRGDMVKMCADNFKECVLIDRPWNQGIEGKRFKDLVEFAEWLNVQT